MPDSNTVHMEVIQYQPAINKEIWSHDATTIERLLYNYFYESISPIRPFFNYSTPNALNTASSAL
jgi:hypothetical protein